MYINRKDIETGQVETIDEIKGQREARKILKEYQISDSYGSYYLSKKPTKCW